MMIASPTWRVDNIKNHKMCRMDRVKIWIKWFVALILAVSLPCQPAGRSPCLGRFLVD